MTALRFVKALIEQRAAAETDVIAFNGGGKTCRISGKGIYRALGVENIRHRRKANRSVVMRRLLSLDFVLEHPGLNWLPTEAEKVEFIEGLGVHSNLIPRRIYYGAVRAQKRYFALKLPVAGGDKTVTFAYVDPGHATAVELNSWGAAHGPLWDAIRAKGRRVEVIAIGAELDEVLRADRMLQLWAAAEPGKVATGLTVKQEIKVVTDKTGTPLMVRVHTTRQAQSSVLHSAVGGRTQTVWKAVTGGYQFEYLSRRGRMAQRTTAPAAGLAPPPGPGRVAARS